MTRRRWLALTAVTPLLKGEPAPASTPQVSMEFQCEDLPQYGLSLVPSSSADYDALLSDIQQRLDHPVDGSPPIPERHRPTIADSDRETSAILINRSKKAIAGLEVVWRYDAAAGGSYRHASEMLSGQGLLLPFGMSAKSLKLNGYWQVILPGSKRYLGGGKMVGDNTDVRPPGPDEKFQGGGFGGGGGGSSSGRGPVRQVTLVLDGVFFADGEFVGPNREGLWERTVSDAQAHIEVAKIARNGHDNGVPPDQTLAAVAQLTGPAPEHLPLPPGFRGTGASLEEYRQWALQKLAFQIAMSRRFPNYSDEREVYMLMGWTETVLPQFWRG